MGNRHLASHRPRQRDYVVTVQGQSFVVTLWDSAAGPKMLVDGQPVDLQLRPVPIPHFVGQVDGVPLRALAGARGEDVVAVLGGEALTVDVQDQRQQLLSRAAATGRAIAGGQVIKAPMPGMVVGVPIQVGDEVPKGGSVVVLQAMKMENELRTTAEGKVVEVRVEVGQTVEQGQVLVVLE